MTGQVTAAPKSATFLLSLKDYVEKGAGHPEPRDTKIAVDG